MVLNTLNHTVGFHYFLLREKALIQESSDLIEEGDNLKNTLVKRFSVGD